MTRTGNLWSPETMTAENPFFFHEAGGVWMQLPHTNLRNGGVETRDLEIGVGGGRTVSLHGNKPWRGNLMGVLHREKEKHIVIHNIAVPEMEFIRERKV